MKKTMLTLIAAVTLLQTSNAFAFGHENEGGSMCSYSEYICTNSDESITACVFANQIYVGVNETPHLFSAQEVPVPKGILGAGLTFSGNDVSLKIQTDAASSQPGYPGSLTVPSLELNGTDLRCQRTKK